MSQTNTSNTGDTGNIQRILSGIPELDVLIEGGFPKSALILLSGYPGAGKSTLGAQYVFKGANEHSEKGVYVCFSETKKSLFKMWERFGFKLKNLEKEGKVSIFDLTSIKEAGIQNSVNKILEAVNSIKAERLVIDSITAMLLSLSELSDKRFLLHLFYKFFQEIECTTIIISDTPWGTQKIGSGIEEFLVDGIILLQTKFDNHGKLKRRLRILKMRWTAHSKKTHNYKISDHGIEVLSKNRNTSKKRVIRPKKSRFRKIDKSNYM